jgi:DNA polymerase elongation subunit (family B)
MIGAFYFFYRKKLKPSSYWIKTIDRKPQELVWLKPTNVKHKLWYVATVAESAQFDLYDSGGNEVKIDTSLMKKGLIIREFMDRLPHIHYGYSKEVAKIYRKHPDNFIEELKKRDLYFPIREYEL